LTLAASVLSVLSATSLLAEDDYVVPRVPTADREQRGNLAYIDNFFSGITGFADNAMDLVAGAAGIILQTAGGSLLFVSDVVGLVDDNPLTRTVTQGFVSTNIAELGLIGTRTGDDYIEINHDLNIPCFPHYRETYLRQDDGGEGWNYIDYFHMKDGWCCLVHVPVEIVAVAVSDIVIRPVGNILRVVSLPFSDDLEKTGLNFVEWSLCKPDCPPVEPVVEIREVPVEVEVVREVTRTITTENYTFRDVLFNYDDSTLTNAGERAVAQICQALSGRNITEVHVVGHASAKAPTSTTWHSASAAPTPSRAPSPTAASIAPRRRSRAVARASRSPRTTAMRAVH
jgi:hypothetical protein